MSTLQDQLYYFTQADLLRRGWNRTLITELLGAPDLTKPNPYYRSGAPVRFFHRARVVELEAGERFQLHLAGRAKRSAAAQQAVATKERKTVAFVTDFTIEIPQLPPAELLERAVANYNCHHTPHDTWHGWEGKHATVAELAPWGTPDSFRDRICVNYLRHACTRYDRLLDYLTRRIGKAEAHRVLFKRIVEVIAQSYPELADQAQEQYRRRWPEEAQAACRPSAIGATSAG